MHWVDGPFDFIPFPRFTLVKTKSEFARIVKELACDEPPPFVLQGSYATAHEFMTVDKTSIVVCLRLPAKVSDYDVYALLAHEATHIWQKVERLMGEQDASDEFEAYAIQFICKNLFRMWRSK